MNLKDYNETQASETKCTEACWSNYPVSVAYRDELGTAISKHPVSSTGQAFEQPPNIEFFNNTAKPI